MEAKKVEFSVVEGKFVIAIDGNADGKPVMVISVDIAQVPVEVLALFKKDPA